MKSPALIRGLSWFVTLLVPVVLVLTGVRALMTPIFLRFEYNTPGFPPDSYGFTKEDRLYWTQITLEYLLNSEDISFLGDLRFEDGRAVFNASELRHMVDVKIVVGGALTVWYVALLVLVGLGVWSWRGQWWEDFRLGLGRGGGLTLLLLGTTILIVLVAFGVFFGAFHKVFFVEGTWRFLYSDTLIRLVPERFWRDSFIVAGVLASGAGLALWYSFKRRQT